MIALLKKTAQFWSDIEFILYPGFETKDRGRLLLAYLRIFTKNSLNRWFHFSRESFLSFKIHVPEYGIFFEEFRQIFVRNVYYATKIPTEGQIIDCGGNIGIATLYFAYRYPSIKIKVFEPSPSVLPYIKKNIQQNKLSERVEIIPAAVSDSIGKTALYERGTAACGNTIEKGVYENDPHAHKTQAHEQIETTLLSSHINETIDLLKLDIEGSESTVIRELTNTGTLKKIKQIVLEFHSNDLDQKNKLSSLLGMLEKNGFVYQVFLESVVPGDSLAIEKNNIYHLNIRAVRR